MKKGLFCALMVSCLILSACSTAYQAKPLPFKTPAAYGNAVQIDGAQVAARAFVDPDEARGAFGFDIRAAGMLPVQVVIDNQSSHTFEINSQQSFLEDLQGNLWPILNRQLAHERATRFAKTREIFEQGAYAGFLGAAAGSVIGAAIGIVTGDDVGSALGKGAAVGAAAGASLGGVSGYASDDARRSIAVDLKDKSLANRAIEPGMLALGVLFFPGEAESARQLRMQISVKETHKVHSLLIRF